MRHLSRLLLLAATAACGSDSTGNNKPPSPYAIAVVSEIPSGGSGNPYFVAFTLEVTLKDDGSIQPGVTVITQVSAGDVAPLPLVTGVNGRVSATWTIQPADQVSGRSESLAFCAPPPGGSFCDTDLFGPNSIVVSIP